MKLERSSGFAAALLVVAAACNGKGSAGTGGARATTSSTSAASTSTTSTGATEVCGDGHVGIGEACDTGMDQLTKHGLGCFKCTNIKEVALATDDGGHLCVLISSGQVKCWGYDSVGQLGYGDTITRGDKPMELGDALHAVNLGTGRAANEIAVGGGSACAVLDDHSLKCWGDNTYGQLGIGDTKSRGGAPNQMGDALPKVDLGSGRTASHVAISSHHACAILDNGAVKCWGSSFVGELGLGDSTSHGKTAGTMGDALPPVDLGAGRTAVAIAVAAYDTAVGFSCALLDDGNVKCWGSGASGDLGQGNLNDVGSAPGQMGDALPPIALFTGHKTTAIAASTRHACALSDDGHVKCWGENGAGLLGQGSVTPIGTSPGQMGDALPPIALGANRKATQIATGNSHACAVLDDKTVKCWGDNTQGELGQGDSKARGSMPGQMGDALLAINLGANKNAANVFAALDISCALLTNGTLKCWGANNSGQLGQGDTMTRGLALSDMGDNLAAILVP